MICARRTARCAAVGRCTSRSNAARCAAVIAKPRTGRAINHSLSHLFDCV
jgi:hypothetical protein